MTGHELAQAIIGMELDRLHTSAKAGALSLDEARKLVLYLRVYEPEEDDARPFGELTDEQLREALVSHGAEAKKA